MKTEKPVEDRVKESVEIMREFVRLQIPLDAPEVQEVKSHLDKYIKEGTCWNGSVSFLRFGRIAEIDLPRRADKAIEIRLRIPRVEKKNNS